MNNETLVGLQKIATEHGQVKKENALKRALLGLNEMKENGLTINFNSLANYTKVSKAWLYRHPQIREAVLNIREQESIQKRTTDPKRILKKKDDELAKIKQKLSILEKENKQLKEQLEIVYGELHRKSS